MGVVNEHLRPLSHLQLQLLPGQRRHVHAEVGGVFHVNRLSGQKTAVVFSKTGVLLHRPLGQRLQLGRLLEFIVRLLLRGRLLLLRLSGQILLHRGFCLP